MKLPVCSVAVGLISATVLLASSTQAHAEGFDAKLGISAALGSMVNRDVGLPKRGVNLINIEALPGYRIGNTLIGLDLNYKWQNQNSAHNVATNLKGDAWLAGLGLSHSFNDKFALQLGVDFFGIYDFKKKPLSSQDGELRKPIGFVLKPQLALTDNLSLDLDLRHTTWKELSLKTGKLSKKTIDYSVGLGFSYIFGGFGKHAPVVETKPAPVEVAPEPAPAPKPAPAPVPEPAPAPEPTRIEKQKAALSSLLKTKETDEGLQLELSGNSFKPSSSTLTVDMQKNLEKAGAILADYPDQKVRVEGYTDTSGSKASNLAISQKRADAVKAALVKGGAHAKQITTKGMGPEKPVGNNATAEGRAANRRVEIYISK